MTSYNHVLDRIAGHLASRYAVPVPTAREAAERLVQECGLGTIIVASVGLKGDQPRQTFGGEPKTL